MTGKRISRRDMIRTGTLAGGALALPGLLPGLEAADKAKAAKAAAKTSVPAAPAVGPQMGRLRLRNSSPTPRLSGSSGPTMVRSIRCAQAHRAIAATPCGLSTVIGTFSASVLVPGLPGAQ